MFQQRRNNINSFTIIKIPTPGLEPGTSRDQLSFVHPLLSSVESYLQPSAQTIKLRGVTLDEKRVLYKLSACILQDTNIKKPEKEENQ